MDIEVHVDDDDEQSRSSNGKKTTVNEGNQSTNQVPEPYIGMEFESEDAARIFYDTYAKHIGFRVRVSSNRRSKRDGSNISRLFVCSKEGFCVRKKGATRSRSVSRQGCLAMILVKRQSSGLWIVTRLNKKHNHPLSLSSGGFRRVQPPTMDEKDKKIRELNGKLNRAKKRLEAFRKHILAVYRDIEEHKLHVSRKVQDIIREIESDGQENSLKS